MSELAPAELAFRVGAFAGALGVVGLLPPNLQWISACVLLLVSLIYFYEIWVARGSRRAQRKALIVAVIALAAAGALVEGWAALLSTPLLAFAMVCAGLGVAGMLAQNGESETPE